MEGLRILLLAATIGAAMAGALYAGVQAERPPEQEALVSLSAVPEAESIPPHELEAPMPEGEMLEGEMLDEAMLDEEMLDEEMLEPMAEGAAMPDLAELDRLDELEWREEMDRLASIEESDTEDIVLESGVRIGPITPLEPDAEAEAPEPQRRRRTRPRVAPGPRLHSNPGQHTVLTARRMIASGELIQGSCYAYLSEVYERAGHRGWRKRTIVYREGREGPYADLDLIRPGDWLYIVNNPSRTPVGTHSVMFVGWQDRARGYARTISHAGWGPPRAGRERGYDVSRTYRIIRPTL